MSEGSDSSPVPTPRQLLGSTVSQQEWGAVWVQPWGLLYFNNLDSTGKQRVAGTCKWDILCIFFVSLPIFKICSLKILPAKTSHMRQRLPEINLISVVFYSSGACWFLASHRAAHKKTPYPAAFAAQCDQVLTNGAWADGYIWQMMPGLLSFRGL